MKKRELYCDDCGFPINDVKDAELAWARYDDEHNKVLVVHCPYACPRWKRRARCLPPEIGGRGTHNLELFVGAAGLIELLAWIQEGEFPVAIGLELVRRLHVPGYEAYRKQWQANTEAGGRAGFPRVPDRRPFLAFCEDPRGSWSDD